MLVQTNLSPDAAAQDLRNSRAAGSSAAPAPAATATTPGADPSLGRLQGFAPMDEEGAPALTDGATADQVTEFLRANLPSDGASALAAQANLNPESVFLLLQ
jgi:hypothetical protein